jgi:hypothetical protein
VVKFYDSLLRSNPRSNLFTKICKFVEAVSPNQSGKTNDWQKVEVLGLSKQQNATECDVYTIAHIRSLIDVM